MFCYANQFKAADVIVIAAPYWDLSFPSLLKVYLEHVAIVGITFGYEESGSVGYCHGDKIVYLSTCGGYIEGRSSGSRVCPGVCTDAWNSGVYILYRGRAGYRPAESRRNSAGWHLSYEIRNFIIKQGIRILKFSAACTAHQKKSDLGAPQLGHQGIFFHFLHKGH